MQRVLKGLLLSTALLPFFLLGIAATALGLAHALGLGPHEKSGAFLLLFSLLVPFGILAGGMLGYALLLVVLRLTSREHWIEFAEPSVSGSRIDAPFIWVRATVHRLMPR